MSERVSESVSERQGEALGETAFPRGHQATRETQVLPGDYGADVFGETAFPRGQRENEVESSAWARLGSLKTAWARLARGCRETIFARKWGYRDANDPKDGKDVKPLIYANPNSAVGESTDTRRMGTIGQSNEPTHPPSPSLWRASVGCYIGLGCRSLSHPPSLRSSRLHLVSARQVGAASGSCGDMQRSQTAATQEGGNSWSKGGNIPGYSRL
jgi:hypothetical protein